MKLFAKRTFSLFLALTVIVGLLSGLCFNVNAATGDVDYVYSGKYIYNWGTREETATFLSPNAIEFYEDNNITYAELSLLDGSSTVSSIPNSELFQELRSLMKSNHSYETSYDATRNLYQYTDCQNSGKDTKQISSFYSGDLIGPSWDSGNTWNREHTWPNSKGDANGNGENDIIMLRPASVSENSGRSNKAYGKSSGYYNPNAESGGKHDLRGDVARIVLYVYVRWQNTSDSNAVLFGTTGVIESKAVLLEWMEEDPVDTWELGRNDSVESITGTRNVFVDYPELAFLLFDEEIPADMVTPSGEGYVSDFSVTATANNPAYGSVSVNGRTITATPAAGYLVEGYTVLSGNATVTRNGNTFKVSAREACTIQINFAPKTQISVTYMENGKVAGSRTGMSGESMTLPNAFGTAPEGYTFLGWVAETVDDTTQAPEFVKAGSSFVPTGDMVFYALYSYAGESTGEGSGMWIQVTNAKDLTAGAKLIMVSKSAGMVAGDIANPNSSSTIYMSAVAVTINADGAISDLPNNAMVLTLGGTENNWTLANASGKLLGSPAAKKLAWGSGTTSWKITISNGSATIANTNTSCGYFRYNLQYPRFTVYASAASSDMPNPELYMLDPDAGVTHYTTGKSAVCEHSMVADSGKVPSCTEPGVMAHERCEYCGMITVKGIMVSEDELVIPANGHTMGDWYTYNPSTCSKEGLSKRDCADCSHYETKTLAKKAHTYGADNKCTKCDAVRLGVLTQPKTQKVKTGATAKFTVKASGNGLMYQWQYSEDGKNWTNCGESSAKTATLSVSATTGQNGNYYRCQVKDNGGNTVYTSGVRLYVLGVTKQPTAQTVKSGATVKFTVSATGNGLKYQWQSSSDGKTWKNCSSSSATKATFSFTSKTSHSGNYYRCKITDSAGNTVYTNGVRLFVLGVTTQPKTQKVESGDKVKFTVKAIGNGLKYQWQSSSNGKTWKNCSSSSATKATFTFTGKTSHNGNYYRCKITDSKGNVVYTSNVRLYVLGIKDQPDSKTVTKGKTAKFTVEATGHGLKYQWQSSSDGGKTWKNCSSSSATKATFSFTTKTSHSGNYYRCKITDSAGNVVYSAKVKLTVKK